MVSGVTIVCFAASYAVAFGLELTRLFYRVSLRTAIMVGFMVAGIVAHTIYLGHEAQIGLTGGPPLSSWYHGCLVVAWILAVAFVFLTLKQLSEKPTSIGIIFLPTILSLVAASQIFPGKAQLSSEQSYRILSVSHGVALLIGTAAVSAGFVAGILYLLQSYRLKNKIIATRGLKLPSLEKLQRICEYSLFGSCFLLLIGLLTGVLLNVQRGNESRLMWTDPVVWTSGVLLVWNLAALTFVRFYKPARQGHKVAYLTFASFVFLVFVLGMILFGGGHGAA